MNNQTDKDIYPRTRKFSVSILRYCRKKKNSNTEFFLLNQLARSGTSIGANIHEAKGSSSRKEFIRFFEIAVRSTYETIYWLQILSEFESTDEVSGLIAECNELRRILSSIILSLKKRKDHVSST